MRKKLMLGMMCIATIALFVACTKEEKTASDKENATEESSTSYHLADTNEFATEESKPSKTEPESEEESDCGDSIIEETFAEGDWKSAALHIVKECNADKITDCEYRYFIDESDEDYRLYSRTIIADQVHTHEYYFVRNKYVSDGGGCYGALDDFYNGYKYEDMIAYLENDVPLPQKEMSMRKIIYHMENVFYGNYTYYEIVDKGESQSVEIICRSTNAEISPAKLIYVNGKVEKQALGEGENTNNANCLKQEVIEQMNDMLKGY